MLPSREMFPTKSNSLSGPPSRAQCRGTEVAAAPAPLPLAPLVLGEEAEEVVVEVAVVVVVVVMVEAGEEETEASAPAASADVGGRMGMGPPADLCVTQRVGYRASVIVGLSDS